MGWNPFKDKKKTTVATVVSRVISDPMLPDSKRTGVIKGIFDESGQLVENILEEVVGSIGVRAERMYQYGKTSYAYGLPSSTLVSNRSGEAVVQSVLQQLEGVPVTLDYYHYGPLNNLHYGWQTLVGTYGYNPRTNELVSLSQSKGSPVYLADLQVVVANVTEAERVNGSLALWGTAATAGYTPLRPTQPNSASLLNTPTPIAIDSRANEDYFRVSYTFLRGKTPITEQFSFPIGNQDPDRGYFQVKYSTPTATKFWTYDDGVGTYPTLDRVFETTSSGLGSFFPISYFRYNKRSTTRDTDANTAAYKTSVKLLKYLGIDFDEMGDAINDNPDIDDVQSALLIFAVPADSEAEEDQRYLYDFFKKIQAETGNLGLTAGSGFSFSRDAATRASVVIQDSKFKMSVQMDGIARRTQAGVIGAVGSYSSGQGSYSETVTGIHYTDEHPEGELHRYTLTTTKHYYRKQITKTLYDELSVYGLQTAYFVTNKYAVTGTESGNNLLIPLDHAITGNYPPLVREVLYVRSLHYVFNSLVVTKIKWYQTGFFAILISIIAIGITIWSMGGLSGVGAALVAATATTTALVATIVSLVLKYIIFTVAMKYFVKAVGPEWAMAIAVIAAAVGMTSGELGGLIDTTWAEVLLQSSTSLLDAVSDFFSDALLGLQKESDLFGLYAKEQMELLEDTQKLLNTNSNLLSPFTLFGESPTDYYNRTVHSGNIGVLGIDAVSAYVGVALTLPTISQTLEMV